MENINMTAVKWLKIKIEEHGDPEFCTISWTDLDDLINQAKQMEKEQIINAFNKGEIQGVKSTNNSYYSSLITAEQYYNETYGKDSNEPNA